MTNILLQLHIAGGSVALLAMLPPILSRKGGRLHRRSGWAFVAGMASVCVSALLLSVMRFFTDPTPIGRQFSMLLVYVSILTGAGMWAGLRVLRTKQRTTRGPAIDIAWAALLTISGTLAAAYGFTTGQPLFIAFSMLGVINGGGQVMYWLRRPAMPMHWRLAHMGNMLGACIVATTAFAIAGGRRIGLPGDSLITWLGPTIVGVPVILFLVVREHRRLRSASWFPRRDFLNANRFANPSAEFQSVGRCTERVIVQEEGRLARTVVLQCLSSTSRGRLAAETADFGRYDNFNEAARDDEASAAVVDSQTFDHDVVSMDCECLQVVYVERDHRPAGFGARYDQGIDRRAASSEAPQ